ncbi:LEA type 2 family protein [Nitrosomonas sp. Nm33]|uniref:LEA type 2 family protein n=1 Tax=Nitrosomonas sp. Nm33 TaxID=133724 RepID=UPI00089C28BD|nr:LEA type 2 family protein [Nitrosomonas sp. Nm33]SDY86721.1 LEA14-like dessication related protein [Nitrosomonas sp. Nm33]
MNTHQILSSITSRASTQATITANSSLEISSKGCFLNAIFCLEGVMKRFGLMLFLGMTALVVGCTQLGGIKQNPSISLADIELVELGLLEQRFNLKLRIQNPNDIALRINGMTFDVELNGVDFAKGLSDQVVTVPRLGEKVMEVKATSTLGTLWKQLGELEKSSREKVEYRLSGRLFLEGLGSVPFERKGDVFTPFNGAGHLQKF